MNALVILGAAALVSWTAPPQHVLYYNAQRSWDHGATWEPLKLWERDDFTNVYRPGPEGQTQYAYVWVDAPYRTDWVGRISACNEGGCGEWSNRLVISTGLRDTLYALTRGNQIGPLHIPIMQEWAWPHDGSQGWKLSPGDSAAFQVMDYETVMNAMMIYVCSINGGKYPLHGIQNECP